MLGGRVFFRWQSRKHVIVVKLLGKLLDQSALTDPAAALHNDERRRFLPRRFNKPADLRLPADEFRHSSPWKCKSAFVDCDFHASSYLRSGKWTNVNLHFRLTKVDARKPH